MRGKNITVVAQPDSSLHINDAWNVLQFCKCIFYFSKFIQNYLQRSFYISLKELIII